MGWDQDGVRIPTDLFEAAVQHKIVEARCPCGRCGYFHASTLWYRFYQKRWNPSLRHVHLRLYCEICAAQLHTRRRPHPVKLIAWAKDLPVIELPGPGPSEEAKILRLFR